MRERTNNKVINLNDQVLWDVPTGCAACNIGRDSLIELAREAEAVVYLGKRRLFNAQKIRRYVDSISN